MSPQRIQRRRTKGWRLPAGAVLCTRPGPFGNPFIVGQWGDAQDWLGWYCLVGEAEHFRTKAEALARSVEAHRAWLDGDPALATYYSINKATYTRHFVLAQAVNLLGGRDLACWCSLDQPCHVDTLLKIANPTEVSR